MQKSLAELCDILRRFGMKPVIRGDERCEIRGIATLEEARPQELSFLSNPRYEKLLGTTQASAVVCKPDLTAPASLHLLCVDDPYAAITILIVECLGYRKHRLPADARVCTQDGIGLPGAPAVVAASARIGRNPTIYPNVVIDEGVEIGDDVVIYPGVYVGPRCRLGNGVILFPNVTIYDDTKIGNRVTIHAGSVIGEDGLGYAPFQGRWAKIPQVGSVELADDVEIGANCTIDRATLGSTRIGAGTKFSNLIAIGHGTHIGEHCMFVAQVGLAGSVEVGNRVTMAGQAGVVGHIRIGDGATIGAKAGVTNSVPDGETYLGQPAIPVRDMKRQVAHVMRLPALNEAVRTMEKKLARLEELERRLAELEARAAQADGG